MSLFLTGEEKRKRLDVCIKCKHFNSTLTQCRVCGCFLKVKAALKSQKCPKNYWNE